MNFKSLFSLIKNMHNNSDKIKDYEIAYDNKGNVYKVIPRVIIDSYNNLAMITLHPELIKGDKDDNRASYKDSSES